jgi:hypothetical protein
VKPLIIGIPIPDQPVGQDGPGEAFGDEIGIVAEGGEEFAEGVGILGLLCHPVHLGLELFGLDGPLPELVQCRGFLEIVLHLGFDLCPADHLLERRLGAGIFLGPDAVLVIHPFDGLLGPDAVVEGQGAVGLRGQGHEKENGQDDKERFHIQALFAVSFAGLPACLVYHLDDTLISHALLNASLMPGIHFRRPVSISI